MSNPDDPAARGVPMRGLPNAADPDAADPDAANPVAAERDAGGYSGSPVADNRAAEEVSPTVPPERHISTQPSREPVDAGVTRGMQIASAWAWRFLVIVAAIGVIGYGLSYVSEVVIPVVVGVLLCALLVPITNALQKLNVPRGPAAGITLLGTLAVVAGLLTLVGTQIAAGFSDLSNQVGVGVRELRDLARINLNITDQQITDTIHRLRDTVLSGGALGQRAAAVGTTATHVVAGLFIALFCLFFFLYQGEQIWSWLVRLFPRRAREKADSSGRKAWVTLTAYVRATVLVAAVDAIGIALGAAILGLPLVGAIGILVFVGAFIPVVGALVSGFVAVLVALVAKGPLVAVIMLAVVIGVQQLEAHVLQPFLMGRAVSVHPLAVILSIATGVVIAGIVGALIAVPTVAVLNTIVSHLAGNDVEPEPPRRRRPPAA
jgi:predicted PurR-regulated permease PerM